MSQEMPTPVLPQESKGQKATKYRWLICALLFFATTINYLDRSVINVVGPTIRDSQHWTDYQYGLVSASFTFAYALGFIIMGKLIDALGVRITYAVALAFWSLAAAGHALAGGALSFGVARFFLGLGESGNFPAAIKTVAEWFPQKERATATGIFNAGSNVGAILAPLIVPFIVSMWNWQAAFILTGLIGLIWVFFWFPMYRAPAEHPRVNQAELELIQGSDGQPSVAPGGPVRGFPVSEYSAYASAPIAPEKEAPVKWRNLLPHRQAWAFMAGKFLTDPVWWFYLFFGGIFFTDRFGVSIKTIGLPLIIIYLLADIGSIAGGWLSSTLIHRGWTANAARKTAMFTCAICVLPVIFAPQVPTTWKTTFGFYVGPWILVILLGLGAASGWWFARVKKHWAVGKAGVTALWVILVLALLLVGLPYACQFGASLFTGRAVHWNLAVWIDPGFNYGVVVAATLIGIAAAAHQGFSANIFTLTSDMFPKKAVGSVVGLGGFAGAVGGMIMATVAGLIKEVFGDFLIMFIIAGLVYVLAVVIVHMLAPGLKRLSTTDLEQTRIPVPVWCVVWAIVGFLAGVPLSYSVQDHTLRSARSFPVYMADVVSGDIFKIVKPPEKPATAPEAATLPVAATAPAATPAVPALSVEQQKANRASLGTRLMYVPLGLAGLAALVGAIFHGVLLRPRRQEA